MKARHFCTYFDRNYLVRGLALHASLCRNLGTFSLDVLCVDETTYELLERLKLPGTRLWRLDELEGSDPELRRARQDRTWVEYLWTLTPTLILRVLEMTPGLEMVTYLDADLFFFSSPESVFNEFGSSSVMLIPHRFVRDVARATRDSGVFNVGMMAFRNDALGLTALRWWREQCNSACRADRRDGKFGDQKYLDDWPTRFGGVCVITHKGANLAPWNIRGYTVGEREGVLWVDEQPLIFYHFHKLDIIGEKWFRSGMRVSRHDIDLVYRPYLRALREAWSQIRAVTPGFRDGHCKLTARLVLQWCLRRRLTLIRLP